MSKKISVLILVDHAKGIDGPHRNVVGTLNALAKRDTLQVTLLTGEIEKKTYYMVSNKVKIILGFHPKKIFYFLKNLFLVCREIYKTDVVYVPTNLTSWLYALFAGAVFKKFIAGPNVTGIPLLMPIYEPNFIMTTLFVDKWIENSEFRKRLCIKAGTDPKQIEVVHHSIDTDDFTPVKRDREIWKRYNLDPNRLKILHVGRANEASKGVEELMETFKKLNVDNQYDLIFVGSKGEFWKDYFLEIPGVYYLGKMYGEELRKIYASSDIFFALSSWETFWFTPLEAMASGLPVVVTPVGVVKEMIPNNWEEGVIIDGLNSERNGFCQNVATLACEALRVLCTDKILRKKIGENARLHIIQKFSEEKLGKKLEKIFFS